MSILRRIIDFLRGPSPEDLRRWREECVGTVVKEFGIVQHREALGGLLKHDLSAFLTDRRGTPVLFLRVAGTSVSDAYPIEAKGRAALRDMLGTTEEEFAASLSTAQREASEDRGGNLRQKLDNFGYGRTLRDFGIIEELELASDILPQFRWRQKTRVYATEKDSDLLLVLHVDYRLPGISSFETYPLDGAGRRRLREILGEVI